MNMTKHMMELIKIISKKNILIATLLILLLSTGCSTIPSPIKPMPRSNDYRYKITVPLFKPIRIDSEHKLQKTNHLIILSDDGINDQSNINRTLNHLLATLPKTINYKQTHVLFSEIKQSQKHQSAPNTLASILNYYSSQRTNFKQTTFVILTQWSEINNTSITEAERLLAAQDDSFCLYMIGNNNIHDNKRLIKPEHCGETISSEHLKTPNKMANLIEKIFFSTPKDSDDDGIYDQQDKCPGTKKETLITWDGCPRNSKTSNPRYLNLIHNSQKI